MSDPLRAVRQGGSRFRALAGRPTRATRFRSVVTAGLVVTAVPAAASAAAAPSPPSGGAALARAAVSDLGIVKTVDRSTAHPGQSLVYTLTVTNHGPDTAHEVTVTDTATARLRTPSVFVSTAPTGQQGCERSPTFVNCSVGTLAAGASAEVRIYTEALRAGRIRDTARVTSASEDPNPATNVASLEVTVTPEPTHTSPPRFTG